MTRLYKVITALMLVLMIGALFAQEEVQKTTTIQVENRGYFGIYLTDITHELAVERSYPYQFGIYVQGVVEDSPAEQYDIIAKDIIMAVNGSQVNDKATFMEMTSILRAGDEVILTVWRNGRQISKNLVLGSTPSLVMDEETEIVRKKQSVGFGGGSVYYQLTWLDLADMNDLLGELGFNDLSDNPVYMTGGIGKGHVGKGFFLGGQGASYSVERQRPDLSPGFEGYTTYIHATSSYGGVTFDKRFPIARNFIGSVGVLLGAGEHAIELTHSNGSYDWTDIDSTVVHSSNSNVRISREFVVLQPRAEVLWMLLPWLGIRAELGYTYGYAPDEGWKLAVGSQNFFEIDNSPNTKFQGLSASIGPWFGF